jgi:hypothetical protein
MSERSESSTHGRGLRGRLDPARTLRGLRGHVSRALVPAVAFAVVAGSTAGAVTIVALSGATVAESDVPTSTTSTVPTEASTEDGSMETVGSATPADETSLTTEVLAPDDATSKGDGAAHSATPIASDSMLPRVLTFAEAVAEHGAPDYAAILTRRFPGAQWTLDGSSYSGLTWLDGSPMPSRAQLDALWAEVAEELAAERAARLAEETRRDAARSAELEARRSDPEVTAVLDSFDPRTIWGPSPDYAAILTRRFAGAQWSLNGNDPEGGLTWLSGGSAPTKAQLDAMWADVAREMALEMDPTELARWAGTGDQIYVDGVLRPRGWVGGANDPQPNPVATPGNLQFLPQLPHTNNGSPVGTINVMKDPTGGQNFEQRYGIQLHELGAMIAEAHGYFGGSHGLGLSLNGDQELMWYSDQVDPRIVEQVLAGIGALPEPDESEAPEAP